MDRGRRANRGVAAASLFVGLFLGAFLAIVLQNVELARERSRQRRSMSAIREVAAALEGFARDHGGLFPPARDGRPDDLVLDPAVFCHDDHPAWPTRPSSDLEDVAFLLEPAYIEALPRRDAWGNRLLYATSPDRCSYTLVSPGRDGTVDLYQPFAWQQSGDLVFADGTLLTGPDGT